MPDALKKSTAPYATFSSFMNFINKLQETGIPSRIDPSVFGNASGSISYSIISSLKMLKLIDDNGVPNDEFNNFVSSDEESRKANMKRILRTGYASLFGGDIDLTTVTAGQFDDHLRDEYGAKGSTIDKSAAFFIAAANFAEEPISVHLSKRKQIAPSSGSRKSTKQRKKADQNQTENTPPSPLTNRYHPFVQGLLDELPNTEEFEMWSIDEQATWLRTAASIFGLLSKQGGGISVNVEE